MHLGFTCPKHDNPAHSDIGSRSAAFPSKLSPPLSYLSTLTPLPMLDSALPPV